MISFIFTTSLGSAHCDIHPDVLEVNPSQVKEQVVLNIIPSRVRMAQQGWGGGRVPRTGEIHSPQSDLDNRKRCEQIGRGKVQEGGQVAAWQMDLEVNIGRLGGWNSRYGDLWGQACIPFNRKKRWNADATYLGVIHGENSEALRSFAGEFY